MDSETFFYGLCLLLLLVKPNRAGCPSGWVTGTGDSCFKFITTGLAWQQAEGMCRDMGGSLAALDTQLKTAFINGYFVMHPHLNQNWWIGGRKIENRWSWTTKLYPAYALTYSYWYTGEPNNHQNVGEECMEIYPKAHDFRWNDIPCSQKKSYICETHHSDVFG